jgi:glutamyl-tRNA(Gln) amidotransferase subunit D
MFSRGDEIIAKGETTIKGIVVSDYDEFIVVKLKNGYDVVLNKNKYKIELVKPAEKSEGEKREEKVPEVKGKISLLATGGTIASKVDYSTGGVSPTLDPEYYFLVAPELRENVVPRIIMSIFSEDLIAKEWIKMAEEIYEDIQRGARGIIMTMGTDTMHYTSAMLSFMLNPLSAPVVITGAQRSSDRGSTDAHQNLVTSMYAAMQDIGEVVICMHAETSDSYNFLIRGTRARKMHTERRDAFRPINSKPIAKVWPDGKIEYISAYRKVAESTILDTKINDKVRLLYSYPGFDGDVIKFYIDKGYEGLVIAATGFGNLPMKHEDIREALAYADKKGVPIVITSQTIYGSTNPFVYSTAREMQKLSNIIYVNDMLTEVAYAKLMFVLGHTKSMKEIKEMMTRNLANEISNRSEIDTYLI